MFYRCYLSIDVTVMYQCTYCMTLLILWDVPLRTLDHLCDRDVSEFNDLTHMFPSHASSMQFEISTKRDGQTITVSKTVAGDCIRELFPNAARVCVMMMCVTQQNP